MKTTLKYIILFAVIFISKSLMAQNIHFVQNGVIEFEKRSNMYALIKKKINKDNESYMVPALDQYKKNNPQFKVAKSTLSFNKDKSLYKWPTVEETANPNWAARDADRKSVV